VPRLLDPDTDEGPITKAFFDRLAREFIDNLKARFTARDAERDAELVTLKEDFNKLTDAAEKVTFSRATLPPLPEQPDATPSLTPGSFGVVGKSGWPGADPDPTGGDPSKAEAFANTLAAAIVTRGGDISDVNTRRHVADVLLATNPDIDPGPDAVNAICTQPNDWRGNVPTQAQARDILYRFAERAAGGVPTYSPQDRAIADALGDASLVAKYHETMAKLHLDEKRRSDVAYGVKVTLKEAGVTVDTAGSLDAATMCYLASRRLDMTERNVTDAMRAVVRIRPDLDQLAVDSAARKAARQDAAVKLAEAVDNADDFVRMVEDEAAKTGEPLDVVRSRLYQRRRADLIKQASKGGATSG
jgi:hypothetical protein